VDHYGTAVLHDSLWDALEAAAGRPDLHVYWCERTPFVLDLGAIGRT
jgi:hypothetical protein